jgi:DNA polymerase III gamma/tau subunit
MSLVDQVIAWGGDRLDADGVARVLGVASRQVLHDLAQALLAGETERCLGVIGELVAQSYDMGHVARDLLSLLRDLVVARVCQDPTAHLDLPDEEQRDLIALAGRTEVDDLLRLHQAFSQGYDDVVRSGQPRAAFEMLLIRLARRPPLWPIDDLLARLGALERRLGGGTPRPSGGAAPASRRGASPPSAAPGVPSRGPSTAPRSSGPAANVPTATERAQPAAAKASQSGPGARVEGADTWQRWRAIVERVRVRRPDVAAVLDHATPLSVDETLVELGWGSDDVLREQAKEPGCWAELCQATRDELGTAPRVVFTQSSAAGAEHATLAGIDARMSVARPCVGFAVIRE